MSEPRPAPDHKPDPVGKFVYRTLQLLVLLPLIAFLLDRGCTYVQRHSRERQELEGKHAKAEFIPPPPRNGYIGSSILKDYAAPNRPVEDDLTDLSHALKNFALLVKGSDPIPLGANEEIALALLGKNRARLAFLPKDSQALNAQGQLIDRWGTPLWFHASTRERIDIRSAGPDQKLWTNDDVHRRYDGNFLKPDELNPRSLNDALK